MEINDLLEDWQWHSNRLNKKISRLEEENQALKIELNQCKEKLQVKDELQADNERLKAGINYQIDRKKYWQYMYKDLGKAYRQMNEILAERKIKL